MVKRTCPQCGRTWYSALEQASWSCAGCGEYLGIELSEPPEKPAEPFSGITLGELYDLYEQGIRTELNDGRIVELNRE